MSDFRINNLTIRLVKEAAPKAATSGPAQHIGIDPAEVIDLGGLASSSGRTSTCTFTCTCTRTARLTECGAVE